MSVPKKFARSLQLPVFYSSLASLRLVYEMILIKKKNLVH